jgi:phosphopantothenoylcysteine decarboxylase/phosphopantothenate--cysteine ligase
MAQAGLEVHVLMTASAMRLVQPQTFLTLSRNPVISDLWRVPTWEPDHVALAERAGILVVAPATANFLGKYAHGIADDALTTYALAHSGPAIVAPAMNPRMWTHPAVQTNVQVLKERGVRFIGPEEGHVACGVSGLGRLAAVERIFRATQILLALGPLAGLCGAGRRLLVTAGPTQEPVDPVRFLGNRSSGKMGYALAEVGADAGFETTLISGPTALARPEGCRVVSVTSAAEMAAAVKREFPACDVLAMCAAVADYRPATTAKRKIRKSGTSRVLELVATEDILSALKPLKRSGQRIMGFAAETHDLAASARRKLRDKGLDWIAANDVSRADIGFGTDCNAVTVFSKRGQLEFPVMPKTELAARLLGLVLAETTA